MTLTLQPGAAPAFLPLMLENARTSAQEEPGCQQFDVAHNADQPEAMFLYEIYDDRAAFDAHLESAHFKSFDTATAAMIATKTVQTWDIVER